MAALVLAVFTVAVGCGVVVPLLLCLLERLLREGRTVACGTRFATKVDI
jgi:hypothetical protein